jgi:translation initiation factor IF-2
MANKKSSTQSKKEQFRAPVVAIMGHVDHGKTTLLDYIRKSRITEKEHGGITQHIGAYQISYKGKPITFIDTPGHEAFSAMRARGANITDIAILVVAADDGVMPQTKESISHIKAAKIPMIIAINKMDAPGANLDRVKKGLAENDVLVEDYGGDVVSVPISAKTGSGVDDLLEMINLVAEMSELKNESNNEFEGVIIESTLDKFRGPVVTILVKKGKIAVGDQIQTQTTKGKIKALINSEGEQQKEASVSEPVEILGLEKPPVVGEVVKLLGQVEAVQKQPEAKLDRLEALGKSDLTQINLVIKADVAGSLEAIVTSLLRLGDEKHKVNIVHKETGEVNESDVLLAASTKAIIIGFNVKVSKRAESLAEEEKIMVRTFNIIYELLDELKEGLDHLVESKKDKILGKGEIIAVFDTSFGRIAGTKVIEGRLNKSDRVKITHDEEVVLTTRIKSIRYKQDEINTAKEKDECGILLDKDEGFEKGDIIQAIL